MTMPIGCGRKTVLGSARPMSQPRKYVNTRESTGTRCRVRKIRMCAARLLLIQGFLGCVRIFERKYHTGPGGESLLKPVVVCGIPVSAIARHECVLKPVANPIAVLARGQRPDCQLRYGAGARVW